jgi:hypothetical protein
MIAEVDIRFAISEIHGYAVRFIIYKHIAESCLTMIIASFNVLSA